MAPTATFHKFEDLPAELRVNIYAFYFQDFDTPLWTSRPVDQPPLTRVNRLLRKEALSLVYQLCAIRFEIKTLALRQYCIDKFFEKAAREVLDEVLKVEVGGLIHVGKSQDAFHGTALVRNVAVTYRKGMFRPKMFTIAA